MSLEGKRVVVLAEDMYEDPELWYPYYRLQEAGAEVVLVGPEVKTYGSKVGYPVTTDVGPAVGVSITRTSTASLYPAALHRTNCAGTLPCWTWCVASTKRAAW